MTRRSLQVSISAPKVRRSPKLFPLFFEVSETYFCACAILKVFAVVDLILWFFFFLLYYYYYIVNGEFPHCVYDLFNGHAMEFGPSVEIVQNLSGKEVLWFFFLFNRCMNHFVLFSFISEFFFSKYPLLLLWFLSFYFPVVITVLVLSCKRYSFCSKKFNSNYVLYFLNNNWGLKVKNAKIPKQENFQESEEKENTHFYYLQDFNFSLLGP